MSALQDALDRFDPRSDEDIREGYEHWLSHTGTVDGIATIMDDTTDDTYEVIESDALYRLSALTPVEELAEYAGYTTEDEQAAYEQDREEFFTARYQQVCDALLEAEQAAKTAVSRG